MSSRMFVAAVPPDHVVEDLEDFLSVRREADRELHWTTSEQWHLTLAFLPAVRDAAYDDLVERLAGAVRKRAPLTIAFAGGGAFPDPDHAKVLWAGVDVGDRAELDRLATGCRNAAVKAGVEVPGERFRPHLTLARSGRPFTATRWLRVLEAYAGPTFTLDRVALIASHLGEGARKRPRYEVCEEFELQRHEPRQGRNLSRPVPDIP